MTDTALLDEFKKLTVNELKNELAWRSYQKYFELVYPDMTMYPHTKYICSLLQKISDGEQHFYIISCPPTAWEESYNH